MQIRLAKPTDVKFIYQFVCELENIYFDYLVFKKLFFKNITNFDYIYLIAEIESIPIGYLSCHAQILLHHCGKVGEIQELFIETAYRSMGIGQALIEEIESIAEKNNWVNLEVTCNKKRTNTHRFYKQGGFVNTHLKFVKEIK